jgi:hypothetical protein
MRHIAMAGSYHYFLSGRDHTPIRTFVWFIMRRHNIPLVGVFPNGDLNP